MKNFKNSDLVSVIIPYYKNKKFIKNSIMSVIKQTYTNIQIIVIFDENSKEDLKFIQKITKLDNRIKLLVNKNNIGAGYSRNNGIKHAKGKFIAFLDSDDTWKKNKLNFQINYMKKNNYSATHTSYNIFNSKKKYISTRYAVDLNYEKLLKSCDIGLSTVMISESLIKKNLFSSLKTKEDYLLWIQLIRRLNNFKSINKDLTYWRYLKNSLSSSNIQKLVDAFELYYNHLNFGFLFSIFCVLRLSFYALKKKTTIYFKI